VSPSAAALTRPFLVVLPALAFLVPALLLTLTRTPTYTAESRLLVGGFDVSAQAIPGFVAATQSLASTYARLVSTPAVQQPAATSLQTSVAAVSGHISATAVPESSIIAVQGTATDKAGAVRFADAGSKALRDYVTGAASGRSAASLLKQFQTASQKLGTDQADRDRLVREIGGGAASAAQQQQLAAAQAAVQTDQLEVNTLGQQYTSQQQGSAGTGNITLLSPAALSGSDRRSTLELALAIAIGLGLVSGLALATVVVNREASSGPRVRATA
jgi:capsular polysaccharide biosynthesis protein